MTKKHLIGTVRHCEGLGYWISKRSPDQSDWIVTHVGIVGAPRAPDSHVTGYWRIHVTLTDDPDAETANWFGPGFPGINVLLESGFREATEQEAQSFMGEEDKGLRR